MCQYFKPISISLSPNVEKDDVKLTANLIIRPWLWRARPSLRDSAESKQSQRLGLLRRSAPRNDAVRELENEFKKYLGVKYAVSFNSGRSSLFAILKSLNFENGEVSMDTSIHQCTDVLLQAFTCNAVPNPVLWAGLNPVYIDCDKNDFNIDIGDLKTKLNHGLIRTNGPIVLVVQHTFGMPANMDEVMDIARQNNLILIEDCAHSLGAKWNGQSVGTFGKAAFFSFSRDKVISSVYGGMAVTNDDEIGNKLQKLQKEFGMPSNFWIFQQLLHPLFLQYLILPIYNFLDLGKIFLVLSQWLHVLSKAVSWQEKRGERPDYFPKALPNALAVLALNQFQKLDKFWQHRKKISDYYRKELAGTNFVLPQENAQTVQSYLRFTIKHKRAHEIIYEAWHNQNILLGDWYTTAIAPFDTKLEKVKYKAGQCPVAESLAEQTLNLPTHINISQKDAERIVKFLKKYEK